MNARMIRICLLLPAAVLLISGAMTAQAQTCPTPCTLKISLPANVGNPPEVDIDPLHVKGGEDVIIKITGSYNNGKETVLFFKDAAFVDDQGKKLYTVKLDSAQTTVSARNDGVCTDYPGCKYTIINIGTPERKSKDPWIIID